MNTKQEENKFAQNFETNFNKDSSTMATLTNDLSLQSQESFWSVDGPLDIPNDFEKNETDDKDEMFTKETFLIKLVYQEQSLYNPNHDEYRNCQYKEDKWLEISQQLGWTTSHVKNKWKAMRDQYCRELKRLRHNENQQVKWKHFNDLEFLRPYALSRSYRPRSNSSHCKVKKHKSHKKHMSSKSSPTLSEAIEDAISAKYDPSDNNGPYGAANANMNNNPLSSLPWRPYSNFTSGFANMCDDDVDENSFICKAFTSSPISHEVQIQEENEPDNLEQEIDISSNLPATTMVMEPKTNEQIEIEIVDEKNDPRHALLSNETKFEKDLIALVKHQEILYNIYHVQYRNMNFKKEVWRKIATFLNRTDKQCRLKWKALRDQFIRELKRLKDLDNVEFIPRWKHYDRLSFLKQYIRHKTDRDGYSQQLMETSEMDAGIEEPLNNDDSLDINATQNQNRAQQRLPVLSGPFPTASQLHTFDTSSRICSTPNHPSASNIFVGNNFNEKEFEAYLLRKSAEFNSGRSYNYHDVNGDCDVNDDDEFEGVPMVSDGIENPLDHRKHQKQEEVDIEDEKEEFCNNCHTKITTDSPASPIIYDITDEQMFSDMKIIHSHNSPTQTKNLQRNNCFTTDAATNNVHQVNNNMEYIEDDKNTVFNLEKNSFLAVSNNITASSVGSSTKMSSVFTQADLKDCENNSQQLNNTVMEAITINTGNSSGLGAMASSDATGGPSTFSTKTQTSPRSVVIDDDDEIDAFFKAIALKIRKAHMPPNDFTTLQIRILKLINDHLGNSNF